MKLRLFIGFPFSHPNARRLPLHQPPYRRFASISVFFFFHCLFISEYKPSEAEAPQKRIHPRDVVISTGVFMGLRRTQGNENQGRTSLSELIIIPTEAQRSGGICGFCGAGTTEQR
jgi:hypothetical protein